MRRRLAALLAATLVAGALAALAPAGPASATTAVCAGNGSASVTPGLLYPIGLPLVTLNLRTPATLGQRVIVTFNNELQSSSWSFNLDTGTCPGLMASGTLKGYCGHSTGSGFTNTGHLLAWTSIGGLLLITNEVTGAVNAIPDPLNPDNSCLHAGDVTVHTDTGLTTQSPPPAQQLGHGAHDFIITGGAVLAHCNASTLPTLTTLLLTLGTVTVLDPIYHITFPLLNVHVSIHACTSPSTTL